MSKSKTRPGPQPPSPNPPVDPALAANLQELILIAEEAGMQNAWLVRGIVKPARFVPVPLNGQPTFHLTGQLDPAGGLLVLLYFPRGDGGKAGVEEV